MIRRYIKLFLYDFIPPHSKEKYLWRPYAGKGLWGMVT